jgi:hypothetical protein
MAKSMTASDMARKRWASVSVADRRAHAMKLVAARLAKRKPKRRKGAAA